VKCSIIEEDVCGVEFTK